MKKFAVIYDLPNREWYGYEILEERVITENFFEFKDVEELQKKLEEFKLRGHIYYEKETKRIEGFGWFDD